MIPNIRHQEADRILSPGLTPLAATQILWRALHGAVTMEHAGLMRVPGPDGNFELFLEVTLAGLAASRSTAPSRH
jgi:hypothetical protein